MKKTLALILAVLMMFSLMSITASADGDPTGTTITFWHARSSGVNYDQLLAAIERFNSTNEYGITVEEAYQGSNKETATAVMTAIAGGNAPTMCTLTVNYVTEFANNGVLADMSGYAERDADTFDVGNYLDALTEFSYGPDGELISFPYCRSTAVFYYNVDMFKDAGYDEAPETMEELAEACKAIMAKNEGVDGFCFNNDDWYIGNFLVGLGSNETEADGMACIEDGTLETVLTAWKSWVEDGWCIPPTVTDATTNMREQFYQGKLACFFESSGGMANILKASKEANINCGVAYLPYLEAGKAAAPAGGTNIGILASASDAEQAAAWEFIKFLASDAESADNSMASGYVPVTKSSAEDPSIVEYWAENPSYKTAFDQLNEIGHDFPMVSALPDVEKLLESACSSMIIDGSLSAEEALEQIKTEAALIDFE